MMTAIRSLKKELDCNTADAKDIHALLAHAEADGAVRKYGTQCATSDAWFDEVGLDLEQFEIALLLDENELVGRYEAAYRRGLERAGAKAA